MRRVRSAADISPEAVRTAQLVVRRIADGDFDDEALALAVRQASNNPPTTAGLVTPTPRPAGPTTLAILVYALQPYAGLTYGTDLELTAAALHALVTEAREEA